MCDSCIVDTHSLDLRKLLLSLFLSLTHRHVHIHTHTHKHTHTHTHTHTDSYTHRDTGCVCVFGVMYSLSCMRWGRWRGPEREQCRQTDALFVSALKKARAHRTHTHQHTATHTPI